MILIGLMMISIFWITYSIEGTNNSQLRIGLFCSSVANVLFLIAELLSTIT